MAGAKTVPTDASVPDFLAAIGNPRRRADAQVVCDLMGRVTGEPPVLWGRSIVGFGERSGWMVVGFAPRSSATVIYLMDGYEHRGELLARLGPHSTGRSCLYLKRLDGVDLDVLEELVAASVEDSRGG